VIRYFYGAAPLHRQDEALHVFPPLLAGPDAALRALVQRLSQDHRRMEIDWVPARRTLLAVAEIPKSGWTPLTAAQTAALTQFSALYRQHLDDEKKFAYPAAGLGGHERGHDAAPGRASPAAKPLIAGKIAT
jgi:hypothetical protein